VLAGRASDPPPYFEALLLITSSSFANELVFNWFRQSHAALPVESCGVAVSGPKFFEFIRTLELEEADGLSPQPSLGIWLQVLVAC
jgi:hypothetical protein